MLQTHADTHTHTHTHTQARTHRWHAHLCCCLLPLSHDERKRARAELHFATWSPSSSSESQVFIEPSLHRRPSRRPHAVCLVVSSLSLLICCTSLLFQSLFGFVSHLWFLFSFITVYSNFHAASSCPHETIFFAISSWSHLVTVRWHQPSHFAQKHFFMDLSIFWASFYSLKRETVLFKH